MRHVDLIRLKISAADIDLNEVAESYRKARNVALENWLLRERGLPETLRQSTRRGKAVASDQPKPKSESTKLYDAVVEAVPELGTQLAAGIGRQTVKSLNTRVDWRKQDGESGKPKRKKDAILAYEERPPFSQRADFIAVPNSDAKLSEADGLITLQIRNMLRGHVATIRLSLKGVPPLKLARLREVMHDGLADSSFVKKKKGWYWHLPILLDVPAKDSAVVVTLEPVIPAIHGEIDYFLLATCDDRSWRIGEMRYLLRQMIRYESRIKDQGRLYRTQRASSGHGRKDFDEKVSLVRQKLRNHVREVRKRAIDDLVRFCERHNAGTVCFRRPTNPVKDKSCFAVRGVNWDWTDFEAAMKNGLAHRGVGLETKSLNLKEVKQRENA